MMPGTAVVEEEVPNISLSIAMKMSMSPSHAEIIEEEVHKQAVHAANAETPLNMAMMMLAVGPRQRCRSTSDMSWVGMTCRP